MRKMQYSPLGCFIRAHNTLVWNVFPTQSVTLSELAHYDGSNGRPTFFASQGVVYDVSSSEAFKSAYGMWMGRDATVCLAKMSLANADIGRTDWRTVLTQKDLETLADWNRYFNEKYLIKGRLHEYWEPQGNGLNITK